MSIYLNVKKRLNVDFFCPISVVDRDFIPGKLVSSVCRALQVGDFWPLEAIQMPDAFLDKYTRENWPNAGPLRTTLYQRHSEPRLAPNDEDITSQTSIWEFQAILAAFAIHIPNNVNILRNAYLPLFLLYSEEIKINMQQPSYVRRL